MSTWNQPLNTPAAYCRQCGKPLREEDKRDVRGMIFCEDCLTAVVTGNIPRVAPPPPPAGTAIPSASPWLAAILAWIPGVGAMYNGQFAKGFVHVLIFAALITMSSHGGVASVFFGLMIPVFWIYMIIDAYQTARARQLGLPLPDPFGLNNVFGAAQSGAAATTGASFAPAQGQNPGLGQAGYPVSPPPQFVPADPAHCPQPIGAFVLIGLGVFFLLANLGLINHLVTRTLWPALLIGLGVWLFVRRQNASPAASTPVDAGDPLEKADSYSSEAQNSGEQK